MNYKARESLWVTLAHCLKIIDRSLIAYVQGLGKIDVTLARAENKYKKYFTKYPDVRFADNIKKWVKNRINKNDNIILAQLWVLGCYEVIRTIEQYLREHKNSNFNKSEILFRETKHFYERIRMPLAKLEPAKRSKGKDFNIAMPGYSTSASMVWKINNEEFIAREDLAYSFIDCLKILKEETKNRS
jgi:hypothetical protein